MRVAVPDDKARLYMSALAALVRAEIGLVAVGHAFETDKSCRRGTELAGRTDQDCVLLGGDEVREFGVLLHSSSWPRKQPAGKR